MISRERILVIRLGALGDLVLCFQAFHEIRQAHPDAEIALLTMPAFAGFARSMPWFDHVLIDERAPVWRIDQGLKLVRMVRGFAPMRVYDLQGKMRQTVLYRLSDRPEWSGAAPGCSHPRMWPPAPGMHFTEFVAAQLRLADVPVADAVDLSWLDAPLDGFDLPSRYVLFIPGCGAGRDYKRWPPERYAELAGKLAAQGIGTVAVGTETDVEAIVVLCRKEPRVIDLSRRTSLHQLAALARRAVCVVGNDTGPTHLAAALGAPTLALMSDAVDPAWSAPCGARSRFLRGHPLGELGADKVFLALRDMLRENSTAESKG